MIPSTAKGKKCFTRFSRSAAESGDWALWEAQVDFFGRIKFVRTLRSQVFPLMGDALYSGPMLPDAGRTRAKARRQGGG